MLDFTPDPFRYWPAPGSPSPTPSHHLLQANSMPHPLLQHTGGAHRALLQPSTGMQDVAANTRVQEVSTAAGGSSGSALVVVPGQTSQVDEEITVQVPLDYTGPGMTLLEGDMECAFTYSQHQVWV